MSLPENLKVIRLSASSRMGGRPDRMANGLLSAAGFVPFSGNVAALYDGAIPPEKSTLELHLAPSTPQAGNYSLNYTPCGGSKSRLLVRGRFYRVTKREGYLSIEGNCAPDGEWQDLGSVTLLCPDPAFKAPDPEADWVSSKRKPKVVLPDTPPTVRVEENGSRAKTADAPAVVRRTTAAPIVSSSKPAPAIAAITGSIVAGYKFVRVEEAEVSKVHPLPGQPRKRFHQGRLRELGESIQNIGLQQLVQVRVLRPDEPEYQSGFRYMLVDGERRLRAHKIIRKPRIGCLIVEVANREEQHLRSLVLNLHQEPHSHWELAMAVIEMTKKRDGDAASVARDLGRSISWVNLYLGLRSLHPELFALLDPEHGKAKQLRLQHAVLLARMRMDKQVGVYEEAVRLKTGGVNKMTSYLKSQLEIHQADQTATGRKRREVRPSTHARNARRGLHRIAATTEYLSKSVDGLKLAFAAGNSYLTKEAAIKEVDEAVKQLVELREKIAAS